MAISFSSPVSISARCSGSTMPLPEVKAQRFGHKPELPSDTATITEKKGTSWFRLPSQGLSKLFPSGAKSEKPKGSAFSIAENLNKTRENISSLGRRAQIAFEGALESVLLFVTVPSENEKARLKRSPVDTAMLMFPQPWKLREYNAVRLVTAATNLGTPKRPNGKESPFPAATLWVQGNESGEKKRLINLLRDLSFEPQQIKQIDFSQLATRDAMINALKEAAQGEGARLVILDNLFDGNAPNAEKAAFGDYLKTTLFGANNEARMQEAGINLNGALLLINTPNLGEHEPKGDARLHRLKLDLESRRFYLSGVPFSQVLHVNQPDPSAPKPVNLLEKYLQQSFPWLNKKASDKT